MRLLFRMIVLVVLSAGIAQADPHDLENGVFILHHAPEFNGWSCASTWDPCERYYDEGVRITSPENQVNRFDPGAYGDYGTWWLLAAWLEEKEWWGVEFGIGEYDHPILFFVGCSTPCWPTTYGSGVYFGAWETPPNSGIILHTISEPWTGNYAPVFQFNGYSYGSYYGKTTMPLVPHPETGRAGFRNGRVPSQFWDATCLGAMGISMDGIACAPPEVAPHVCCTGEACYILFEEDCAALGGEYDPGRVRCETNPCGLYACCIAEECFVMSQDQCLASGGEWRDGLDECPAGLCRPRILSVQADGMGEFPSIRAAIEGARDWDVIELNDGTYVGPNNRDLGYQGKQITVRSQSGDPASCIIDCQGSEEDPHAAFRIEQGEGIGSLLEGVTITNGYPAGIVCEGAYPSLANCVIAYNSGAGLFFIPDDDFPSERCPRISGTVFAGNQGPGVHSIATNPIFTDCVFTGNSNTWDGGGVSAEMTSRPSFLRCVFSGNSTESHGGGVYVHNYVSTIRDCLFLDNHADGKGGGIASGWWGLPEIIGCTFARNSAGVGGGAVAFEERGVCRVAQCTFYANEAPEGCGLFVEGYTALHMARCILAFGAGGEAVRSHASRSLLTCCDIYGNTGGDWVGSIEGLLGIEGNISEDPCFCDAASLNFHLRPSSPCAPFTPPNPECDLIGSGTVGCEGQSVDSGLPGKPHATLDCCSYPNPFNTSTSVSFQLSKPARVRLTIHDVAGRAVRVMEDRAPREPGPHQIAWDGTDDSGRRLSSGIYFYSLNAGSLTSHRRVLLLD